MTCNQVKSLNLLTASSKTTKKKKGRPLPGGVIPDVTLDFNSHVLEQHKHLAQRAGQASSHWTSSRAAALIPPSSQMKRGLHDTMDVFCSWQLRPARGFCKTGSGMLSVMQLIAPKEAAHVPLFLELYHRWEVFTLISPQKLRSMRHGLTWFLWLLWNKKKTTTLSWLCRHTLIVLKSLSL